MNPSQYEEDTIDLVDLFYYLLKKWRSLLVILLLGILVGGGLMLGKTFSSVQKAAYEPGDAERLQMDEVYQQQLLYEQQLAYNKEAFVMQLDPDENYVSGELRYYIDAGQKTDILGELLDITRSNEYMGILHSYIDYTGNERYIDDVVECGFLEEAKTFQKEAMPKEDEKSGTNDAPNSNNIVIVQPDNRTQGILTYRVQYMQRQECEKLLEDIKIWVDKQNTLYQELYGAYIFEKVGEKVQDVGNIDVVTAKSKAISTAVELQAEIDKKLAEFDDRQAQYYNTHYLDLEEKTSIDTTGLLKWAAIGAFVACVLWGIWWVVAYLASGTVRQIDVLTQQYKLPLLGRVESASDKQKGLDGKISRWADGRKPAPCTPEYLSSALELLPAKEIVLCQTSADPESAALVKELKKHSAKPVCSGVLHTDAGTLSAGKRAGGIFLLVTLKKTKLEELKAELRACELHDLQVLGVVVLG